jgi:hypothetical protein
MKFKQQLNCITGEHIKAFARILPSQSSDHRPVTLVNNMVRLVYNDCIDEFHTDGAFDETVTLKQVYHNCLSAFTDSLIDGFNVTGIFIGGTANARRPTVDGDDHSGGVVHEFVSQFFRKIKAKETKSTDSNSPTVWNLRFSAVTIIDNKLHDLLGDYSPAIIESEWEGLRMEGATEHSVRSPKDFHEHFQTVRRARSSFDSHFSQVVEKACCVYLFTLRQLLPNGQCSLLSKYMFCQLPELSVLLSGFDEARKINPVTLDKGVFAIYEAMLRCRRFSNEVAPNEQQFGNAGAFDALAFEDSHETLLLKSCLLGPSKAYCLASLQPNDIEGTVACLKMTSVMREILCFPVANNGNQLGAFFRLRLENKQLRQLCNKPVGRPVDSLDNLPNNHRLQNDIEKLKMTDDCRRMNLKIEDWKTKCAELTRQKISLSDKLIASEREKLKLGQALAGFHAPTTVHHLPYRENRWKVGSLHTRLHDDSSVGAKEEPSSYSDNDWKARLAQLAEDNKDLQGELETVRRNCQVLLNKESKSQLRIQQLEIEIINLANQERSLKGQLKECLSLTHSPTLKVRQAVESDAPNHRCRSPHNLLSKRSQIVQEESVCDGQNDEAVATVVFDDSREVADRSRAEVQRLHQEVDRLQKTICNKDDALAVAGKELAKRKSEMSVMETKFEQLRQSFRDRLVLHAEGQPRGKTIQPRDDLIKSYADRERELLDANVSYRQRVGELERELAVVTRHFRKAKELACLWAPLGQVLPPFMTANESSEANVADFEFWVGSKESCLSRTTSKTHDQRHSHTNCNASELPQHQTVQNHVQKPQHWLPVLKQKQMNFSKSSSVFSDAQHSSYLKTPYAPNAINPSQNDAVSKNKMGANNRCDNQIPSGRFDAKFAIEGNNGDTASLKKVMCLEKELVNSEKERSELLSRALLAEQQLREKAKRDSQLAYDKRMV